MRSKSSLEPRREPSEKNAELERHRPSLRVNDMHRQWLHFESVQHNGEAARSSRSFHLVRHDTSHTSACNGRLNRGLRRVHSQSRPNGSRDFIAIPHELPTSRHPCLIDCNAVVDGKIVGRLGMPPSSKVFWAGASHDADGSDPSRDHAAVRKRPDTNGDVDLVFDRVQDPMAEQEAQGDIRVNVEELTGEWEQVEMPEAPWRRDCEVTRWSAVLARSFFFGVVVELELPRFDGRVGA
jgi:hypothetical protein